jgi:hypothetical protein
MVLWTSGISAYRGTAAQLLTSQWAAAPLPTLITPSKNSFGRTPEPWRGTSAISIRALSV